MSDYDFNFDTMDLEFPTKEGDGQEIVVMEDEFESGLVRDCMNMIFLLDTSGSMHGQRINQLNTAMPIALDAAREAALTREIDLYVRAISFNSKAKWIIGDEKNGVPVETAYQNWENLTIGGNTDTAAAIELCLKAMHTAYMGTRNYHPVVVLITDGKSDNHEDTQNAIEKLRMAFSGGSSAKKDKVWRLAIGVEDANESELHDFAMTGKFENEYGDEKENVPMVFKVDNVTDLARVLKNVTVSSLTSNTLAGDEDEGNAKPIISF